MDINKQWQKLEQANFNQTIKKEEIMKAIQMESTSTIAAIKNGLRQKINWAKFFVGLFVGIALVYYNNTGITILMSAATLLYLLGIVALRSEYIKINPDINSASSVIDSMKGNLAAIKSAINKERLFGLLSLPVMLVVGLSFSTLKKGGTFTEVFSQQYSIIAILVFVGLVLFLGFGAEKMNKIAFGGHISKLENQIRELEKVS